MEFYDVVAKRRTVRDFSEKPVDEAIINQVLEAGVKAPSYNHLREWEFILVKNISVRLEIINVEKLNKDIDLDKLKEAFEHHDLLSKEMYLDAIPKQKKMILTAPELLVVCYKPKTNVLEAKRVYDLNGLASVWCCIENILLAMADEGLFGVTYVPQDTEHLKEILNIPNEYEISAIIPIGYPAEKVKVLKPKKINLEGKLHINRW
jgi:nitroreductase